MQEREETLAHGEYAINWVKEQINAGRIRIDENGKPNIIGNRENQDFDDSQVN